ncbi:YfdX family protein [candidate division KSB1 bacterium]|nr:YfdX family protein [candidate division KSB1 bacterium]
MLVLIVLLPLIVSCTKQQPVEKISWNPVIDQNDIIILSKPINDFKKHLNAAQQFDKKGQKAKSADELKLMKTGIGDLEYYYIPLVNAKLHLSAAYRLTNRNEIATAQEELNNLYGLIFNAKSYADKRTPPIKSDELNSLINNFGAFNSDFTKVAKDSRDKFIQYAEQIQKLITPQASKS